MRTLEDQIKDIQTQAELEIANIKAEAVRKADRARERELAQAKARQERIDLKARLERENGTEGMLKADLLWQKAWEFGHASGLYDVENWYNDLVELIK